MCESQPLSCLVAVWLLNLNIVFTDGCDLILKWLASNLATLNRFNVLKIQLIRVLLEQVLPHAQQNLAGRDLPYRVIWIDMHVFHRILEQGC